MTQAISGIIQKQCDKIENILGKIQLAYISMKKKSYQFDLYLFWATPSGKL